MGFSNILTWREDIVVLAWLEFYNSILLTDPPDGWGRVLMMMREEEEMVLVLFHPGFISSSETN